MLQTKTAQYIENNQKELVLEILNMHQNEPNFDTKPYEEMVSTNLNNYINEDNLISLDIPILYRILAKYFDDEKNKEKQKDEIIEFLFKNLDKKGRKASVLFNPIFLGTKSQEYITRLITNYSTIFDFQYITSQVIDTFIKMQKDFVQLKEKYEEKNQLNDMLNKQIESQKQNLESKENEILRLKQIQNIKRLTDQDLVNKFQNLIPINKQWKEGNDLNKFSLNEKMVYEVESSTFFNSIHLSRNLFDGKNELIDDRNVWACAESDNNPFIQIKFSEPVLVYCLSITARRSPWNTQAPSYFEIFGIKDNNQEILLEKFTKSQWIPNEKKIFPFENYEPFSIYKIKFRKPTPKSISLAGLNLGVIKL